MPAKRNLSVSERSSPYIWGTATGPTPPRKRRKTSLTATATSSDSEFRDSIRDFVFDDSDENGDDLVIPETVLRTPSVGPLKDRRSSIFEDATKDESPVSASDSSMSLESRLNCRIYGLKLGPFEHGTSEVFVRDILWTVNVKAVDCHCVLDDSIDGVFFVVGLRTWEEVRFVCKYVQSRYSYIRKTAVVSEEFTKSVGFHLANRRKEAIRQRLPVLKISGLPFDKCPEEELFHVVVGYLQQMADYSSETETSSRKFAPEIVDIELFGNLKKKQVTGFALVTLADFSSAQRLVDNFEALWNAQCKERYGDCIGTENRAEAYERWTKQHSLSTALQSELKRIHNEQMMSGQFSMFGAQSANKRMRQLKERIKRNKKSSIQWPTTVASLKQPLAATKEMDARFWVDFVTFADCATVEGNVFVSELLSKAMTKCRNDCEKKRKIQLKRTKATLMNGSEKSAALWRLKACDYAFVLASKVHWSLSAADLVAAAKSQVTVETDGDASDVAFEHIRHCKVLHTTSGFPFGMALFVLVSEMAANRMISALNGYELRGSRLRLQIVKQQCESGKKEKNTTTMGCGKKRSSLSGSVESERQSSGVASSLVSVIDAKPSPSKSVRFKTPIAEYKSIPARVATNGSRMGGMALASLMSLLNQDDSSDEAAAADEYEEDGDEDYVVSEDVLANTTLGAEDWAILEGLGFAKAQDSGGAIVEDTKESENAEVDSDEEKEKSESGKKKRGKKKKGKGISIDNGRVVASVAKRVFGERKGRKAKAKGRDYDCESAEESSEGSVGSEDDIESVTAEGYTNRLQRMVLRGGKLRPSGGRASKLRRQRLKAKSSKRGGKSSKRGGKSSKRGRSRRQL